MINVKEILKYINSRNGESSISEINKLINEQDRESKNNWLLGQQGF